MVSVTDVAVIFSYSVFLILKSIHSGRCAPVDVTKLISMHQDMTPSQEENLIHALVQKAARIDSLESDRHLLQNLLSDINSGRFTAAGSNVKRSTLAVERLSKPTLDMGFGRSVAGGAIGAAHAALIDSQHPGGPG
ncbi:uncharacterized protein LOC129584138 [Paramacrobiotus metropolitanus]|uniref:uncharacterized protein LOC129584138 n=1 Tax=Paramacrobiotus metropolitanus TaxID=2943436 RepID=UPI002445EEE9|nr:uncharacterized protein LOC129584138 [Paramacrobiotus metropolitanus]